MESVVEIQEDPQICASTMCVCLVEMIKLFERWRTVLALVDDAIRCTEISFVLPIRVDYVTYDIPLQDQEYTPCNRKAQAYTRS